MWEKLRVRYRSIIVRQLATCSHRVPTCLFSFGSRVVILFPLPSRIGTGNTGHMFTYLSSQKCWKTGRTLSILVSSLCLLALTGLMQTKHVSLASLWELESLWGWLRKVAVVCPLVAREKKIVVKLMLLWPLWPKRSQFSCTAASTAILYLILAL